MKLAVNEVASFEEQRGEFMAAARLEYLQDESGVYGVSIPILTYDGTSALAKSVARLPAGPVTPSVLVNPGSGRVAASQIGGAFDLVSAFERKSAE